MNTAKNPFVAVGIGEILWDLLPAGKQLGGAPANFAYHAAALGAEGLAASCVGDDPPGREICHRLASLGMGTQYIAVDPSHPTGTVSVQLDAAGVPSYIIHENVAWDFLPASPPLLQLAVRAHAICFGSLAQRSPGTRGTIRQFLKSSRKQCLRIFDINLRQAYFSRDIVEESLSLTDVLKLNDQELPLICKLLEIPGDEEPSIAELMRRYSLRAVALTCGDKGSRLYLGNDRFTHPGFRAEIVDTVGAGDSFTAALAIGLLRNEPGDRINLVANRLAAHVCSHPGATPTIPAGLGY